MQLWTTHFSEGIDRIGGYHFFHYGSCKTRLWLYHRNIEVGMDNDHIRMGKYLDETTLSRGKKNLAISGLCAIDYILDGDRLEVHEIKKGRVAAESHRLQVLFYLDLIYELLDVEPIGYLHYPETRQVITVERNTQLVDMAFNQIVLIVHDKCPKPVSIQIAEAAAVRRCAGRESSILYVKGWPA